MLGFGLRGAGGQTNVRRGWEGVVMDMPREGTFVGRVWREGLGPCVVVLRDGEVVDITARGRATVSELLAGPDPVGVARGAQGERLAGGYRWLAPCDLQAVKACGVTFARSMIERVIEERAGGDPARAEAVRAKVGAVIGESLRALVPGSAEAAEVKRVLIAEGLWSQYLEVGIGPMRRCSPNARRWRRWGMGRRWGCTRSAAGTTPSRRWCWR